nr:Ig-like domain-containing protein [Oscillochloris sp. ZM17-4]
MLGQITLVLTASAAPITATVAIASFNSTNVQGFQLNGSSALAGSVIRLTPAIGDQAGSTFWKNQVSLANQRSFSTYFVMDMSGAGGTPPGGADGIVFTIQTQSNTAGGSGGSIGYGGITPSVGVEFDTWANNPSTDPTSTVNDPNDNHVGLDIGGDVTSVITATPPGVIQDNTWHVWVDYNGATKNLQVRMHPSNSRSASTLVLNTTRDMAADIGPDVYIGFTAGTGGAYENHDIAAFYFVNDYAPIDTNPPNVYNPGASSVTVAPSPASIATGATSVITATVRDSAGAVMANQSVTFTTSMGSLVTASGVTNASGQVSITLNGGPIAGTATIRATAAGGAYGETSVAVTGPSIYILYLPYYIQGPPR